MPEPTSLPSMEPEERPLRRVFSSVLRRRPALRLVLRVCGLGERDVRVPDRDKRLVIGAERVALVWRVPPERGDTDGERVCCLRSAELNRCSDVDGIPCRTGRVILERGTPLQVINEEHDSYVPSSIPEWSNATNRCSRYGA